MAKCYRIMGTDDSEDTCSCCGRQGLKRVVWVAPLDPDGGIEDSPAPYGTTCAARLLGYTYSSAKEAVGVKKLVESEAVLAEVRARVETYQNLLAQDFPVTSIVRTTNRWGVPIAEVTLTGGPMDVTHVLFSKVPNAGGFEVEADDAYLTRLARMESARMFTGLKHPLPNQQDLRSDIRHGFRTATKIELPY